jgi:hypothetical protein
MFESGPFGWLCAKFRSISAGWDRDGRYLTRWGSLASDFPISAIFYLLLTVAPALFMPFAAFPLLERLRKGYVEAGIDMTQPPPFYNFCSFMLTLYIPCMACISMIFLTLTVICDPGIVSWARKGPAYGNGMEDMGELSRREVELAQQCVHSPIGMSTTVSNVGSNGTTSTGQGDYSSGGTVEGEDSGGRSTLGGGAGSSGSGSGTTVVIHSGAGSKSSVNNNFDHDEFWSDVHYCPVCCVSVEGFDHHCGVIGACIGQGTMACFICFLLGVAFTCGPALLFLFTRDWHLLTGFARRWENKTSVIEPILEVIMSGGLTFVSMAATFGCGGLGFHYLWLAVIGKFSLSRRRRSHTISPLPDQGSIRFANFAAVFRELRRLKLAPRVDVVHRVPKAQ